MSLINNLKEKNLSVVVCPRAKFIYLKTHKVAGQSIYKGNLRLKFKSDIFEGKHNPEKMNNWYKKTRDNDIKDYYKFTFVRNPWDRAVSNYFYAKQHEKFNINYDFNEFLQKLNNNDLPETVMIHAGPIHDYFLYNGNQYVDYIGRFENLQNDWNHISSIIGASKYLKKINSTKHDNYRNYYNNSSIEIVEKIFKKEIDYLGYKF